MLGGGVTMDKYEAVKDLGAGNFGVARLMRNKVTKELVAMKYIERGHKVSFFFFLFSIFFLLFYQSLKVFIFFFFWGGGGGLIAFAFCIWIQFDSSMNPLMSDYLSIQRDGCR